MIKLVSVSLVLVASFCLALGAYPASYSVEYGFVTHGGVGPHGHYLPAVARVKIHKDPFQNHYSLDEEGPTHYKYVRHSSPSSPIIHAPLEDHYHHHQPHHHVAAVAAPVVPVHGEVHHGGLHHGGLHHGGIHHGGIHHGGLHHGGVHHGGLHHGGIIAAAPAAIHVPAAAAVEVGGEHYYNDYGYGGLQHAHHGHHGGFY